MTASTDKSTPRPWRLHLVDDTSIVAGDASSVEVATCCDTSLVDREDGYNIPYERMEADAALIVKAVNAHDGLVAALREAREAMSIRLNANARKLLAEEAEAERAVGSGLVAAAIQVALDADAKARAAIGRIDAAVEGETPGAVASARKVSAEVETAIAGGAA